MSCNILDVAVPASRTRWLAVLVGFMFLLGGLSSAGSAQDKHPAPNVVKYSGAIAGAPSGSATLVFAIYESANGGAPLWQETQSVTLDAAGRYIVLLGARSQSGIPVEIFHDNEARWLGVAMLGQVEEARVMLVSVPYAIKAADAETLGGLPPSAYVRSENVATQPETILNPVAWQNAINLAATAVPITGTGTPGYLPYFSGTSALGNSMVSQSGGTLTVKGTNTAVYVRNDSSATTAVGSTPASTTLFEVLGPNPSVRAVTYLNLGQTPPAITLYTAGGTSSKPAATASGNLMGLMGGAGYTGSAFSGQRAAIGFVATENWTTAANGAAMYFTSTPNGKTGALERMRIDQTGYVGIGTRSPASPLTVAGTVQSTTGGFKFPDNTTQSTAGIPSALGCTGGQLLSWNGTKWSCYTSLAVTSVKAGAGLMGSIASNALTLAADTTYLQRRVSGICAAGHSVASINSDGTVVCTPVVSALPALSLAPGIVGSLSSSTLTLGSDMTYLQRRVGAVCPAGQAMTTIKQDGTVSCVAVVSALPAVAPLYLTLPVVAKLDSSASGQVFTFFVPDQNIAVTSVDLMANTAGSGNCGTALLRIDNGTVHEDVPIHATSANYDSNDQVFLLPASTPVKFRMGQAGSCPMGSVLPQNLVGTVRYRLATASDTTTCPTGLTLSGSSCVDMKDDMQNCGKAATACSQSFANGAAACIGGTCGGICNPGYADCDKSAANGCEVNTASDSNNCGACGHACTAGMICSGGACLCNSNCAIGSVCSSGSTCASGVCNSGACAASSCSDGVRNGNETDVDCGGGSCPACRMGKTCAAGTDCVSSNCQGQVCAAGTCGGSACQQYGETGTTPVCTNVAAGTVCAGGTCDGNGTCITTLANGSACTSGSSCTSGFCANGFCCNNNCSGTCMACSAALTGGQNGTCASVRTGTDPMGQCPSNGVCGNTGSCANGACQQMPAGTSCGSGATCNGTGTCSCGGNTNCAGVCVNESTDVNNCGACGNACAFANGGAACIGGVCSLNSCNTGYANCDGNGSNGCETPITTTANCGACGHACTFPNGGAVCAGGLCALNSCNTGYANCDGIASNGCETATATDPNNCGSCGRACLSGQTCSSGQCVAIASGSACTSNVSCASGVCGTSGTGNCCTSGCITGGTCGATSCSSTGACQYPSATTSCGGSGTCDGSGTCAF